MSRLHVLHEDAFYAYFQPYRHPDAQFEDIWGGHGLETYGRDLDIVLNWLDRSHVWTVVEGANENDQWITPGIRYVNRVCYLVTRRRHNWIEVDFRVRHRPTFLTSLGLRRQIATLKRLLSATSSQPAQPG